jgi:6-phosphogluconolactonase
MVDGVELIALRIGANEAMRPIDQEVPRGGRPSALAVSWNVQWLFGTHPSLNSVSAFEIGEDGGLSEAPGSPFPSLGTPRWPSSRKVPRSTSS